MKKSIILSCLMACNMANCVNEAILDYSVLGGYMLGLAAIGRGFGTKDVINMSCFDVCLDHLPALGNYALISVSFSEEYKNKKIILRAAGVISTVAHFSYLIMKKIYIKKQKEADIREQEYRDFIERVSSNPRAGSIRLTNTDINNPNLI